MASKLKNLEDLFKHEIKDLYSAENQLIKALPKMAEEAHDPLLKKAFEGHLRQTEMQKQRLEQICQELGMDPDGEKCKAMEGLIEEGSKMIDEKANPDTKDAGLIATAQRVEHYEISGYGTARHYAAMLGHNKVADLLEQTLNEEKAADEKLNDLAIEKINKKAQVESTAAKA